MVEARYLDQSQVQLFICIRKLKDVEYISKSDPFVEIFEKTSYEGKWSKLGQTEIIWNNLNPDFIRNFTLDYHFEEQKYLKFRVYDANDEQATLAKSVFIGEAECTLGEIVGSPGQQLIKTLKENSTGPSCGNIILRVEEINQSREKYSIEMEIEAKDLDDPRLIFNFCPFFYISRSLENGGSQRIYASDTQKGKNVTWQKFFKTIQELCNGDFCRPLFIEVYDNHYWSGNHELIGIAQFSLKAILEDGIKVFNLENPQKYGRQSKSCGKIIFKSLEIRKVYSFLEYISGGCQISLMIAVDFTSSNGDPNLSSSLHYLNPRISNQYEQALFSVADILLNYDSDKLVPIYGFGAEINRRVSHCFHMNSDPQDPNVYGLEGVMNAYKTSLRTVRLSGPTLFSQILERAVLDAEQANISQYNQQYYVLLILTDGDIHDMRETIDWIVRGSSAPLSIVIVGIGNDSFSKMITLDADDDPLIDSRGRRMERDIVQFVPFRDVGNSPSALAREVLAEIPREIVNFFSKRNITPNPSQRDKLEAKDQNNIKCNAPLDEEDKNIEPLHIYPYLAPKIEENQYQKIKVNLPENPSQISNSGSINISQYPQFAPSQIQNLPQQLPQVQSHAGLFSSIGNKLGFW
ncbi:unnamed protein product [Blepharisma stoltei]|uniref:Copine family protein n=1 Tax=Blepharisma stoltei TaxID=1481888 RepID=A0AAU9J807_9CILI|nr:unnamed protein product [Blepharisma stoltei]